MCRLHQMSHMRIDGNFLAGSLGWVLKGIQESYPETEQPIWDALTPRGAEMLANTSRPLTSVRDEMDFLRTYLSIEEARFGDRLRVAFDVQPEAAGAQIPSLILQPLVENAIKHGLSPKIEGGSIIMRSRVEEEKLVLEVEDDGVGMDASEASATPDRTRIGMANVSERLKVLYPNTAWMTVGNRMHGGTIITLHLPYLGAVRQQYDDLFRIATAQDNRRAAPPFDQSLHLNGLRMADCSEQC